MSLLTTVQNVCAVVGVQIPFYSVFAAIASNRTMQEMLALANEMAQRIAYDMRDWTALRDVVQFSAADGILHPTGDMGFLLPANFKRMLLTSNVRKSSAPRHQLTFVSDSDKWLEDRMAGESGASWGEWMLTHDQLLIHPPLVAPDTVIFTYLDKNCVTLAGGGFGDRFQNDADSFRLDERLLKLGMIWQWKAQKGSPYAEDMGTYQDAVANVAGHDKPSPIIIGGRRSMDVWGGHAQY